MSSPNKIRQLELKWEQRGILRNIFGPKWSNIRDYSRMSSNNPKTNHVINLKKPKISDTVASVEINLDRHKHTIRQLNCTDVCTCWSNKVYQINCIEINSI